MQDVAPSAVTIAVAMLAMSRIIHNDMLFLCVRNPTSPCASRNFDEGEPPPQKLPTYPLTQL